MARSLATKTSADARASRATSWCAAFLAVATGVSSTVAQANGVPTGCAVTDELVEIRRVFDDVSTLTHLAEIQAKVETARKARGADQPRFFEQIRFQLYLMRDFIARQNKSAAISVLLPHADSVLASFVTVRRVEMYMERVIGLKAEIRDDVALKPALVKELAAIDLMARPKLASEPARAEPKTAEDCRKILDTAYDTLKARRELALTELGPVFDTYAALVKELSGRIKSKTPAEYTPEEKMVASILEIAGFERMRKLAPELVGRLGTPTIESIEAMIKSSPIAIEARLTAMLKAERGATFFGVLWQCAVLNNPQYNALILKFLPHWKPFVDLFQRVASDNLYFERHYSVIDQIIPTRAPADWREPTPNEAYRYLLEKYTQLGDPLLISFFRKKASTDWPQKLMDHMGTLTSDEGKSHAALFAAARKSALALGPLPEYQSAMRSEQVVSGVLHAVMMMVAMSAVGSGGYAMFGGQKVTVDELEEAIRRGEERHASLTGSTSDEDRSALALLDGAASLPPGILPDGEFAGRECFQ